MIRYIIGLAAVLLAVAASAGAYDSYIHLGSARTYLLQPAGAPRIVEGRVRPGEVFFRQPVAYSRTGVLAHDLDLAQPDTRFHLPTGTELFYAQGAWCTVQAPHGRKVCLGEEAGQWTWRQRDYHLHIGCLFSASCRHNGPPQLHLAAQAPVIRETALPPAFVAEAHIDRLGDGFRISAGCTPAAGDAYGCYGSFITQPRLTNSDLVLAGGEGTGARLHYDYRSQGFTVTRMVLDPQM